MGLKLFVGNLTTRTTSHELQELFSPFGTVRWAEVVSDPRTGACRGFGFVQMESVPQARVAVTNLHGRPFHGRMLRVGESGVTLPGTRPPRRPRPRGRAPRP